MRMIEVDIIARRGDVVALVEVKYRPASDSGLRAVSPHAAMRLQAAASQIAANMLAKGDKVHVRVDMIAIAPWRLPVHIRNIGR